MFRSTTGQMDFGGGDANSIIDLAMVTVLLMLGNAASSTLILA